MSDENNTVDKTQERKYSIKDLKEMLWDYVTDATSSAKENDRFVVTRFLDWLRKENESRNR